MHEMEHLAGCSRHPQAAQEAYNFLIEKQAVTPRSPPGVWILSLRQPRTASPPQGTCPGCPNSRRNILHGCHDGAEGFHTENQQGIGLPGIWDPAGDYGAGIADLGNDPAEATRSAHKEALAQAGRPGEVPSIVLIGNTPGHEESVIRAIEEYVGIGVPIVGATSADNDMSGQWCQFANALVSTAGVSLAVLFPSGVAGFFS